MFNSRQYQRNFQDKKRLQNGCNGRGGKAVANIRRSSFIS